ncbi:MAG: hypothetical protein FWG61_09010 [Firmicutes bacterium]|nr:hypothetical protein [Bacillota bacterium]
MKPEYANIFVVSSNSSRKESVVSFYYEYPEFNNAGFTKTPQDDRNININSMQRVLVSSIVLTSEAAQQLGLTLLKSTQDQVKNPGTQN